MSKAQIKLTRALSQRFEQEGMKVVSFPATLGDSSGTVLTGTDGIVNVTPIGGATIQVLNRRVPNKPFLQVIVGFDDDAPGVLQVLRLRDVYATLDTDPLVPDHAKTHDYAGGDTIFVASTQFKYMLLMPSSGFEVQLLGGVFQLKTGAFGVIENQTIDLSGDQPATGALYALIEYDDTGAITVTAGSTVASKEVLALSDIPALSDAPIWAVRLYAGQTVVQRDPNGITDFVDLRFGMGQARNTIEIDGFSVDLSTDCLADPVDGDVLLFDGCNQTWYPAQTVSSSLDTDAIDGIIVDNTPAPTDGQVLTYDVHTDTYGPEDPGGGGGTPTWGDIIGTLANQTDLQGELDAKTDNDGWVPYSTVIPTRASADDPTYVLTFAGVDLTSIISVGKKLKWTQNSTVRYGIVTAISFSTNTTLTLYGGNNYDVEDTGVHVISAFNYSTGKAPLGFPLTPSDWDLAAINDTSVHSKTTPVALTWYGGAAAWTVGANITASMPIGWWDIVVKVLGQHAAAGAAADCEFTLSTTNNSVSNPALHGIIAHVEAPASNAIGSMLGLDNVVVASKTTWYLMGKTGNGGGTLYFQNAVISATAQFKCKYL